MSASKTTFLSVGIVAIILIVFSFNVDDVVREDVEFASHVHDNDAKLQADNSDAMQFVGHPLTGTDKVFESGVMQEVMASAETEIISKHALPDLKVSKSVNTVSSLGHLSHSQVSYQLDMDESSIEDKIRDVVAKRREQDKTITDELLQADTAAHKAVTAATVLHNSPKAVLSKVKQAHSHGQQQLSKNAQEEASQLRSIIASVEGKYHGTAEKAADEEKTVKNTAHDTSVKLQTQAKGKTAAVIANARKDLRSTLKSLSETLTDSVDRRQRARAKLVELRSKHVDEVQIAKAALDLAKVNQATHVANENSRSTARNAHNRAARTISFAKIILASRLKAIKTTEQLTIDKVRLYSHAVMTEAKKALSQVTQSVLMALDEADASTKLEDVVGKSAILASEDSETETDVTDGSVATKGNDLDMELDATDVDATDIEDDDELLGNHGAMLTQTAKDTIYTSKMHKCKFPFVYNGQKNFHCKRSAQGNWCATHVDKQSNVVKKWDYCVLNQHAVVLAKKAAMEAAKMEIKRVLAATGAQLTAAALHESLRAAADAQVVSAPATKSTDKPGNEDLKDRKPVIGSVQAADQIDRIIDDATP